MIFMHVQQNRNIIASVLHHFAQVFLCFHRFRSGLSMRFLYCLFPEKQKPDRRQIDKPVRVGNAFILLMEAIP